MKLVPTKSPREQLKEARRQLRASSKVYLYGSTKKSATKEPKIKLRKKEARQLTWIKNQLTVSKIEFTSEFLFSKIRKFRADIALKDHKIIIEYEGIINHKNNHKSGHTTIKGYTKDCEKYNLAAVLGYIVLRYTAINYKNSLKDVCDILKL